MKQIKAFCLFLIALAMTSCAHFHDEPTKSVWSGGLWIIFWLPFLGSIFFLYRAWIAYNSGTVEGGGYPYGRTRDVKGKPPMYKNGWLWFGIILQVAAWVICYIVNRSA